MTLTVRTNKYDAYSIKPANSQIQILFLFPRLPGSPSRVNAFSGLFYSTVAFEGSEMSWRSVEEFCM